MNKKVRYVINHHMSELRRIMERLEEAEGMYMRDNKQWHINHKELRNQARIELAHLQEMIDAAY